MLTTDCIMFLHPPSFFWQVVAVGVGHVQAVDDRRAVGAGLLVALFITLQPVSGEVRVRAQLQSFRGKRTLIFCASL